MLIIATEAKSRTKLIIAYYIYIYVLFDPFSLDV